MTVEAIHARVRRQPFTPFRLILSSGDSYNIFHPKMLHVSRTGLTIAIYDRPLDHPPSADEIPARDVLVSHLHVAAIEDLRESTSKAG